MSTCAVDWERVRARGEFTLPAQSHYRLEPAVGNRLLRSRRCAGERGSLGSPKHLLISARVPCTSAAVQVHLATCGLSANHPFMATRPPGLRGKIDQGALALVEPAPCRPEVAEVARQ